MKILVPVNNSDYIDQYIECGADEFYLGFYDEQWENKFGKYADINRMSGFGKLANKYNFEEAMKLAAYIKKRGKAAFITMNANSYSLENIEYIEKKYLPAIKENGIDGIIISDIELAKVAVDYEIDIVASTMCAIYNSDIAREYLQYGFKRQIIPRDVSLDEIRSIINNMPNVGFEVFFMRNGCVFSDSYCLGMHRPECGSTCGFMKNRNKQLVSFITDFIGKHNMEVNDYVYNKMFHNEACAMCALYRLKEMGVGSLKIVGRADMCERVCEDIKITKQNIEIIDECDSEQEYLSKMKFPNGSLANCKFGLSCYYPEVRF